MTLQIVRFFRQYCCFISVVCAFTLSGCNTEALKKELGKPQAKGRVGEIMVVIDSNKWNGPVGEAVRRAFASSVPGLLGEEPAFTLRHIVPYKFNDFIRRTRNVIIVAPMEGNSASTQRLKQFFSTESLERIAKDDTTFMYLRPNEFAMGQMVMFLFGPTDQALVRNIDKNLIKLEGVFNDLEIKRMTTSYLAGRAENGKVEAKIRENHQVSLALPAGYKFVMEKMFGNGEAGFVWARAPEYEIDRNLFVAYKPYLSEKQFEPDSVLAWRNQLCQSYIFGDPAKPRSYVITEKLVPPTFQKSQVGDRYAVEMRGLWRTYEQVLMGGPFLSYVFADPEKGRLYYAEGFLYAPAKERKRELMREFEVVLKNIK
jgi:Domain of unknown function (DUF4837)